MEFISNGKRKPSAFLLQITAERQGASWSKPRPTSVRSNFLSSRSDLEICGVCNGISAIRANKESCEMKRLSFFSQKNPTYAKYWHINKKYLLTLQKKKTKPTTLTIKSTESRH